MNRRQLFTVGGGAAAAAAAWLLAARARRPDERALLLRILQLRADDTADKIAQFLNATISQIGWTTQLPWSVGTMEQRRFDALRLLQQAPAISELAFLDASGTEQLKVSRVTMDVTASKSDFSHDPKFTEAVAHRIYYGPVYLVRHPQRCDPDAEVRDIDGLGVYVTLANGQIKIVAPIDNMPAAKAGIMAGDIVVALDGEPVQGLALGQVVEKMRGPVNTRIKLTIMRSGHDAPIEFSIARDAIREGASVDPRACLPVSQPASSWEPHMTISLAGTRREAGVSVADVNLGLVRDLIVPLQVGAHGIAYLLDAEGRVLVHPDMFRPAFITADSSTGGDLSLFQRDFSSLTEVQAARAASQPLVARDIDGRQVLAASASVAPPGWRVFVELPLAEADTAVP